MVAKTMINIGLVLLIVLGIFSNIHSAELVNHHFNTSDFEDEMPTIKKSFNDVSFDLTTSLIHTCHVGHGGCYFNLPSSEIIANYYIVNSGFILVPENSYASPDQKLLKRPPIS